MNDLDPTPRPRFQFSLANILLAMMPLAAFCFGMTHGLQTESSGDVLLSVTLALPAAFGTMFWGFRGLVLGLLAGWGLFFLSILAIYLIYQPGC